MEDSVPPAGRVIAEVRSLAIGARSALSFPPSFAKELDAPGSVSDGLPLAYDEYGHVAPGENLGRLAADKYALEAATPMR